MTRLSGATVLVTGAGGFIGGHLVTALVREGARVRAMVRYNSRNDRGTLDWVEPAVVSSVEVVPGELRDIESVTAAVAGSEIVCHLGALIAIPYSYVNPRDYFEVNVLGTLNVAQASRAAGVSRLVHMSTSEVYGSARVVPITETHPLEPQSPYAASKLGADKLIDSWNRSFELPTVVLRPFNTYGPRQSMRAIIPTIIAQALAGDTLQLGSLDPRRDLTFVEDTVRALLLAAVAPGVTGRTIQLGTGEAVSIGQIVEMVGEILGSALTPVLDERRVRPAGSEVNLLISEPTLAGELLGWRPEVSLREGLTETIAWLRPNQHRFREGDFVI